MNYTTGESDCGISTFVTNDKTRKTETAVFQRQQQKTERKQWISNLRVIATVSVIILHVAVPIVRNFSITSQWWIGNIYDGFVRYCVPVFVMITGALLLPQEVTLKAFLQKRFFRALIPFLFWSIIYILYGIIVELHKGSELSLFMVLKTITGQLLYGASYHLWYIYMIIGLYLFIPILTKWIRNSNEKEIIYFLSLWIISMFAGKISYFSKLDILYYFSQYIGYLVLGYYLSIKEFKLKINTIRIISILLFFTGCLITVFGTYFLSVKQGYFAEFFYDYLTPNILVSTIGIFLFVKSLCTIRENKFSVIVSFIDKYSYGIYLVHVLVLTFLYKIGMTAYFINPIIGIPLTALLCLGVSTLIILILSKLPLGKYISG
jgi:surface polysaccharide O-acyltransferase-like enzyme